MLQKSLCSCGILDLIIVTVFPQVMQWTFSARIILTATRIWSHYSHIHRLSAHSRIQSKISSLCFSLFPSQVSVWSHTCTLLLEACTHHQTLSFPTFWANYAKWSMYKHILGFADLECAEIYIFTRAIFKLVLNKCFNYQQVQHSLFCVNYWNCTFINPYYLFLSVNAYILLCTVILHIEFIHCYNMWSLILECRADLVVKHLEFL